jgi:hypothetical protein
LLWIKGILSLGSKYSPLPHHLSLPGKGRVEAEPKKKGFKDGIFEVVEF